MAYRATNNTIPQLSVPQEIRGRVMSFVLLDRGMTPLGRALAGALASSFGAPLTIGAMAAAVIVLAIIVSAKVPQLWQLE
ncbi:MAG: hypothetical protein Q8O86_11320 [Dehalococcoidia bacterium]|nr:hypothetical protein [Dehalococcoidia bacterium]